MKTENQEMKIIQFQAMPNDQNWQGSLLGLGDDGVMYVFTNNNGDSSWEPLVRYNKHSEG